MSFMTNEDKAKAIISKILYITIATVSPKGQPWNTPVYSAFDEDYNFYWNSDQNGQHSKNIDQNSKVFLVIYDSNAPEGTGEGVYIQAKVYMITNKIEIEKAIVLLEKRKTKPSSKFESVDEFMGEYPRRVYKAVPEKFWINGDSDVNGNYIDVRFEIDLFNE